MSDKALRGRDVRHIRILNIRSKVQRGWGMPQLITFCIDNLGVSRDTALSYIDEAAKPYRKKYREAKK